MSILVWLGWLMSVAQILCFRLFVAALIVSVLLKVIVLSRNKLPVGLRSQLWGTALLGLFIPFERSVTILAQDIMLAANYGIRQALAPTSPIYAVRIVSIIVVMLLPFVWLSGLMYFAVKAVKDAKRTLRSFQQGTVPVCAAYFHRWRSHIYLPPDFHTSYTIEEQQMLLAHESQHIAQHDPILYRLLPVLQCVFWFSPPVHKAVRLFQQDRELLCDRRVTKHYSKREYSHLLLKSGAKKPVGRSTPGFVAEAGDVRERVEIFIKPVSQNKKITAAILIFIAAVFAAGFVGLAPVSQDLLSVYSIPPVKVYLSADDQSQYIDIPHIEGMERYVISLEDGVAFNQQGMYDYAIAQGLSPQQRISVQYVVYYRPVLYDGYLFTEEIDFAVSELLTGTVYMPINVLGRRLMKAISRFL